MSGVYSMSSPTYTGASRLALFDSAMSQPLSITSTLVDQAKGGALESFGLGTVLREGQLPEQAPTEDIPSGIYIRPDAGMREALMGETITSEELAAKRKEMNALTEDQYKGSAFYRKDIPYDPGMTEARAAALSDMDDAKKVREFYAQKRPFSAFIGNLAGQALDPINYIPVTGELVTAAAVARAGRIGGRALAGGLDAAANTAIFGIGTAGMRAKFGDDVSWQSTVSQIATAALIGSAFGAISGAVGKRVDARRIAEAESRLATLKTTQEARIALNEGIDALVRGEDVRLSPNSTEPMARIQQEIIAYHGSPHTFDEFSREKIGTGEGAQAYGRGLYFAENPEIAKFYKDLLSATLADEGGRVTHGDADFAIMEAGRALGGVGQAKLDELSTNIVEALRNGDDAETAISVLAKTDQERAAAKAMLDAAQKFSKGDPGALYEVGIKADQETFLDWDKPLSQQSEKVQDALKSQIGDWERFKDKTGGEYVEYGLGKFGHETALMDAGIPGIKYLDASSRAGGEGSRNYVVFDDSLVRIRSRNGVAIDTSPARPDPLPEGIKQAEASIAKPDDAKALAAQYRVDPQTGAFDEEGEVAQLAAEGRLTEEDAAALAQAHVEYETGAAYADALRSVAGCLI